MRLWEDDPFDIDPDDDLTFEDFADLDEDDEDAPWFECDCALCNGFDDFDDEEDGW